MSQGLPRGWNFQKSGAGVIASIVVPAIAGVSHVLTGIAASILCYGSPAATAVGSGLSVNGVVWGFPVLMPNALGHDDFNFSGEYAFPPGQSLTVGFGYNVGNYTEYVQIQGYDR